MSKISKEELLKKVGELMAEVRILSASLMSLSHEVAILKQKDASK